MHAKNFRCPGIALNTPIYLLKSLRDMLAFDLCKRLLGLGHDRLLHRRLKIIHQSELRPEAHNHRAFNDVFQLTDISWPIVVFKGGFREMGWS